MVDHNLPLTVSVPTTYAAADRIVGTGELTVDGVQLELAPGGGTIGMSGSDTTTIIRCINGGSIKAVGGGGGTVILETDGGSAGRADWGGIQLDDGPHNLDGFEIRNAKQGLFDIEGIQATFQDITIEKCGAASADGVLAFTSTGGRFRGTEDKPNIIKNCDTGLSVTNPCDVDWITVETLAQLNAVNSIITGLVILKNITLNNQTFQVEIRGGDLRVTNLVQNISLVVATPWVLIDYNTTSGGAVDIAGYKHVEIVLAAHTHRFEVINAAGITGTFLLREIDITFIDTQWFRDSTVDQGVPLAIIGGVIDSTFAAPADSSIAFKLDGFAKTDIVDIDMAGTIPITSSIEVISDLGASGSAGDVLVLGVSMGKGPPAPLGQVTIDRVRKYTFRNCFSFGISGGFASGAIRGSWDIENADVEILNCRLSFRLPKAIDAPSTKQDSVIKYKGSTTSPALRIRNSQLISSVPGAIGPDLGVPYVLIIADDADGSKGLIMSNTTILHALTTLRRPEAGIVIQAPTAGDGTTTLDLTNCTIFNQEEGLKQDRRTIGTIRCCQFELCAVGWKYIHATFSSFQVFVNNNLISNTAFGVENTGAATIDALLCYWNSADGPSGVGPGSGDPVSAGVAFEPFAIIPCEIVAVIIGDLDITDQILDALGVTFYLNAAAVADFTVEDLDGTFTREGFGGKLIEIFTSNGLIYRGFVEIATPTWKGAGVRWFRIMALDGVGRAKIQPTSTLTLFNYTTGTDPAQVFRDTIDSALALAFPSEDYRHTIASIPDSTELVVADFRQTNILEIWNTLLDSTPGRAFWVDPDGLVNFREPIASAETLEAEEVWHMENPFDIGDTFNLIDYQYADKTRTVLPRPLNLSSILDVGTRVWSEKDPDEFDDDSASAKADAILASRGDPHSAIPATIEFDFTRFSLWTDITINIPLMELDGVTKRVTEIKHIIHLFTPDEDPTITQGDTIVTIGSIPLRVSDILQSLNE